MRKTFLISFFSFCLIWVLFAYTEEMGGGRLAQIDRQIEKLENEKRGYESRALRHENQAERLQFDDQALLETRRHLQLAEENRRKAALVQEEIDQLKVERAKLTQKQAAFCGDARRARRSPPR